MTIEITARAKAFSGHGIGTHRFSVDENGAVRVWDPIAGNFTLCHSLSSSAEHRIRRMAGAAGKRQTVKQFVAVVKRIAGEGVRHQTNAWPYPQASQSHIAFWLDSWPHEPGMMPARRVCVSVVNSDCPGELVRVAADAKTPSEVAAMLSE